MSLPRMRTAAGVFEIIKEQDPDTEVTANYVRCLVKSGRIPTVLIGRKRLVDADAVIAYIAAGNVAEEALPKGIRKVEERLV